MPDALEAPWVTLDVNDVTLSLCDDLGRPNLGMTSRSRVFLFVFCLFVCFYHLLSLLSPGGKDYNLSCECIYHD